MSHRVEGTFDVKIHPQQDEGAPEHLGRMVLDKKYHGALDATGKGQMLTGMTSVKTSAGYVAMERVDGALEGKQGSFILQHSGTMSAAGQQLTITVVPDSGTGELAGITGKLDIKITNGQHFYIFEYSLPE